MGFCTALWAILWYHFLSSGSSISVARVLNLDSVSLPHPIQSFPEPLFQGCANPSETFHAFSGAVKNNKLPATACSAQYQAAAGQSQSISSDKRLSTSQKECLECIKNGRNSNKKYPKCAILWVESNSSPLWYRAGTEQTLECLYRSYAGATIQSAEYLV